MTVPILIVDDEQIARKRICSLLNEHHETFEIKEATDVVSACQLLENYSPFIVFLDINMPKFNGFDFISMKPQKEMKIIFQTAYSEYAAKAFEVDAENYLLKPFSKERFNNVLNKALATVTVQEDISYVEHILVKIGQRERLIEVKDIYYFSTTNHSTYLALKDRSYSCSHSLQELEDSLNPEHFIRIHRNTLLNFNYVESWTNSYPMFIHLENGESLRVSKERRRKVREFISNV